MSRTPAYAENIAEMIKDLKKDTAQCHECFRYFIVKKGSNKLCDICANASTDASELMVVEKDSDLESVRKSRVYSGKYFVLGGLVPIIEKTTKRNIRIEELKEKIKKSPELKEVILAFSLNPQGDHTDQYVRSELRSIIEKQNIKVSSLGRGLSTGTELEYSDNDTLKNALKNRQ
jgi:recombination protein RecR